MTTAAPRPGDGTRVFMIDNYDSFTYNLVQYLGELGAAITVKRNDHVTVAEIAAAAPDAPRRLPRSLHAERGGHQHGRHRPLRRRAPAGARRLPRPPGHRPGVRRRRACAPAGRCTARPTQIHHDGAASSPALPDPVHGDALPLAGRRRGAAGLPGAHGVERRGGRDGRAATGSCRCTACSSIPRAC